jgi:hypothetical protein
MNSATGIVWTNGHYCGQMEVFSLASTKLMAFQKMGCGVRQLWPKNNNKNRALFVCSTGINCSMNQPVFHQLPCSVQTK